MALTLWGCQIGPVLLILLTLKMCLHILAVLHNAGDQCLIKYFDLSYQIL